MSIENEILEQLTNKVSEPFTRIGNQEFVLSVEDFKQTHEALRKNRKVGFLLANAIVDCAISSDSFGNNLPGSIQFRDCIFLGKIKLTSVRIESIHFENCYFLHYCILQDITFNSLHFSNCFGFKTVEFSDIKGNHCSITGTYNWMVLRNWNVQNFLFSEFLEETCSISTIRISCQNSVGNINFKNCLITDFTLEGEIATDTSLTLNQTTLNELHFMNVLNRGNVIINSIYPDFLAKYSHKKELEFLKGPDYFRNVSPKDNPPKFIVTNSLMGEMYFHNVCFSNFRSIQIRASAIDECHFTNCEFTNLNSRLELTQSPSQLIESPASFYKDIYRQFKHSLQKSNDHTTAEYFHTLEMKAYLKAQKSNWCSSKFLILYLSNLTSNFGISLSRPLITYLVGNAFLFAFLIISQQTPGLSPVFNFSADSWNTTFSSFIHYSNPFGSLDDYKTSAFLLIGIIAMRIISSYCIYNFIRASRRFVK